MNQEQINQELKKLQNEKESLTSSKAVLESEIKNLSAQLGIKEGDDIDKLISEAESNLTEEQEKLQALIDQYESVNGN